MIDDLRGSPILTMPRRLDADKGRGDIVDRTIE
jgi:hypothetical protein